jgi:alpha-mannosidase/mannosylglycerate hydrolase
MNLALGSEYPQGFLDLAWRNLLKNHAHDSIAGCVSDQVNRDIMYRFDQSRLVSSRLVKEATCQLAASIEGDLGDDEFRVVVFNPLPRPIDQVVEIILQIPPAWPTFNEFFGYEPKSAFHIYGLDEKELLYQRLNQTINRTKTRVRGTKFTEVYNTNDVAVALQLSIPAMGYTTLTVRAGFQGEPTRHPIEVSLATSECSMANEFMEVTIESNGSLTILDKQTGQVYHRLMTFEDSADIGDGWFHGSPVADKIFVSTACKSDIVLVQNGPELTTFEVRTIMSVPEEFHFDRMTRSDRLVEMVIQSQISLRSNQDFIEVRTIVDNPANDHRLRVLFPSGVKAATYLADTPFDVVERSIPLRRDNHLYRELEVETKPQQSWTAVFEAHRGLAVIADALLETSVRDLPERPLALTLFRATRRTALPDGDRDGQMRGRMIFNYCILPFAGQPDRTRLCEMGHLISAGLQCAQLSKADQLIFRQQRHDLPLSASFLCLEGPAVITSVCEKHNRLEVRMFNPSEETIHARLLVNVQSTLIMSLEFYQMVNFESEALGAPEPINGAIELTLASKKIFTLQIIGSSGG